MPVTPSYDAVAVLDAVRLRTVPASSADLDALRDVANALWFATPDLATKRFHLPDLIRTADGKLNTPDRLTYGQLCNAIVLSARDYLAAVERDAAGLVTDDLVTCEREIFCGVMAIWQHHGHVMPQLIRNSRHVA